MGRGTQNNSSRNISVLLDLVRTWSTCEPKGPGGPAREPTYSEQKNLREKARIYI